MNKIFFEFESIPLCDSNAKFDAHFVKRKLNMSDFSPRSMNERLSEHRNRARYINKMYDSMYKRSYAHSSPALADFTVDLIDTEDWRSKFDKKDQKWAFLASQ